MNGTPEKHSFSSSEEKERKTEGGGGGAESKMEGKDRMGFGGGAADMVNIFSYFTQVQ